MNAGDDTVHLSESECWSLLESHSVARLAVDIGGQPDIFPINYLVDGKTIVFRSAAGTKLAGAVLSRHVAIEIDGLDDDRSVWSVVVKGMAREIEGMTERWAADDLPLYPWIASEKPNFVRIEPRLTTGRRFHVVEGAPGASGEPAGATGISAATPEHHPGAPKMRPD
ncbi:pyridoxamine 5'-phosphate oxidase family protein [Ilumatobacter sp.]|uniref:pyridoxamine 5'-phosphate oxidase family protein n=1 Tax=Ilumatobacter sp. TaxID=1967498 RepID=UPI003AF5613E